jgi:hypothetical protein
VDRIELSDSWLPLSPRDSFQQRRIGFIVDAPFPFMMRRISTPRLLIFIGTARVIGR